MGAPLAVLASGLTGRATGATEMVTYGDVRRWRAGTVEAAGELLGKRLDDLLGLADELDATAKPARWHVTAATAADTERRRIVDRMEHFVAEVSAARTALLLAAEQITGLTRLTRHLDETARHLNCSISETGLVVDQGPPPGVAGDKVLEADRAERKKMLAADVRKVVTRAIEVDNALADVLAKVQHGRVDDGGAGTLADAARAGANQVAPARPPVPGAPPVPESDAGAGEWGSDPWYKAADDLLAREAAEVAARSADSFGLTHAAAHLRHYLGGTGTPYTVEPDRIAHDVPTFHRAVERAMADEVSYLAVLAERNGTYGQPVQFGTGWRGHYLEKDDNKDWHYAMGGIRYAVTGVAVVHPPDEPGGAATVEVDYRTHVYDRYNWDDGKKTKIGRVTITDDEMGEMHRAGVAREYDISGSTEIRHYNGPVRWNYPLDLPSPPDSRDGSRTDPGRGAPS